MQIPAHYKKTKLEKEAERTRGDLVERLEWIDYENIIEKSKDSAEAIFLSTTRRHIEKFKKMMEIVFPEQHQGINQETWVVNLSSRTLTDAEERVLRRGLNFAPAPRKIPTMDIAAAIEAVARRMVNEEAADLRGSVRNILKKAKLPPPNLQKDERAAIKALKEDKNITILPADKGNATVVMDTSQYVEKVKDLLTEPVYEKVKKDLTPATERRVLKEIWEMERRKLTPKDLGKRLKPVASKLYGLPKIHKPQVPLRPIVSCIGSLTYHLAKYITSLISPLVGQTSSFIMNSQHFTESITDIHLQPTEVMVSFDVKALFTNVPTEEALQVIHRLLLEDESLGNRTELTADQITHLLDLCIRTTYFIYGGEYYQQKDGAAMGSPVSPVVANIYMERFEDLALRTTLAPRIWKRYVEDTFCVMEKRHTQAFLDHLNSVHPTIQFTMELENEGSLPFLDTLLTRREDGGVNIGVYRKRTHTDRYLHYTSHHPAHIKRGVVSCLFTGQGLWPEEKMLGGRSNTWIEF